MRIAISLIIVAAFGGQPVHPPIAGDLDFDRETFTVADALGCLELVDRIMFPSFVGPQHRAPDGSIIYPYVYAADLLDPDNDPAWPVDIRDVAEFQRKLW